MVYKRIETNCAVAMSSVVFFFRSVAHALTQSFVAMITEDSRAGRCMRFWFAVANIAIGGLVFGQCRLFSQNLNATFWLGLLPQTSLLVTMTALASSFTTIVRIRIVQHFRNKRQKEAAQSGQSVRECCEPTPNVLRAMLLFLSLMAIATVVFAILVLGRGNKQFVELSMKCGVAGESKQIQDAQNALVRFQQECHGVPGQSKYLVHQCPGYNDKFAPPQPYVHYLARLEVTEHCSGFCTKPAQRFFTKAPPRGTAPLEEAVAACVTLAAPKVRMASWMIGVVGIAVGVTLFFLVVLALRLRSSLITTRSVE
eukprot:TRINITY_DN30297_c0_g1_i1.p1 TRINITY_DN30297_c0_g1~~TRINITY_DN30297_c0_g1_i1.p1  ORF type:complete len:312 (+),score=37.05 TRINITY_DN30297_c0_g1_i1:152-1087(+)